MSLPGQSWPLSTADIGVHGWKLTYFHYPSLVTRYTLSILLESLVTHHQNSTHTLFHLFGHLHTLWIKLNP